MSRIKVKLGGRWYAIDTENMIIWIGTPSSILYFTVVENEQLRVNVGRYCNFYDTSVTKHVKFSCVHDYINYVKEEVLI